MTTQNKIREKKSITGCMLQPWSWFPREPKHQPLAWKEFEMQVQGPKGTWMLELAEGKYSQGDKVQEKQTFGCHL